MISVVIPLHNEEESLATLHSELNRAFESNPDAGPFEILFVDDGSRDRSWEVLKSITCVDPKVKAIRFRRNFGKAAALTAGFAAAKGTLIFTLDADLQDDPAEISRFLETINKDLDVVSGWKRKRYDPWHKVYPSRIFNQMVSWITGCELHDHNCGFKLYRSDVIKEVKLYGELHRFVPALAHARGFRVGELEVHHRARQYGRSKYGVARFLKGLLDLVTVRFLTRFGQRPLHLLGSSGLFLAAIGGLDLFYLGLEWLAGADSSKSPFFGLFSATLLGIGVQLVLTGLIGELVTSYNICPQDTYSIAEIIEPSFEDRERLQP